MNEASRKPSFKSPSELHDEDLLEVERLVLEGGEVDRIHVRQRLREALLIGRLCENESVIAVAVIKRPATSYIQKLRERSGFSALSDDFRELGYMSVLPRFRERGLGKRIATETLKHALTEDPALKLFATTRKDSVRHILCLNGFRKEGREWVSEKDPGSSLDLWILPPQVARGA